MLTPTQTTQQAQVGTGWPPISNWFGRFDLTFATAARTAVAIGLLIAAHAHGAGGFEASKETPALNAYRPQPKPNWAGNAYDMAATLENKSTGSGSWLLQQAASVLTALARKEKHAIESTPGKVRSRLSGAYLVKDRERGQVLLLLFETGNLEDDCHACGPLQSAMEYEATPNGWKLSRAHVGFDRVGTWGKSSPHLVLPDVQHGYVVAFDYAYMANGKDTKGWLFYGPGSGAMQQIKELPSRTAHTDRP